MYIPINKKTGLEYPAISTQTKSEWERNPVTRDVFVYRKSSKASTTKKAKEPTESKKADGSKK